jgi:hypothetical protein
LGLLPGTSDLKAARNLFKPGANFIFYGFEHRNLGLRKYHYKTMLEILFGEGQVQGSIPAISGYGTNILAVLLGDE